MSGGSEGTGLNNGTIWSVNCDNDPTYIVWKNIFYRCFDETGLWEQYNEAEDKWEFCNKILGFNSTDKNDVQIIQFENESKKMIL